MPPRTTYVTVVRPELPWEELVGRLAGQLLTIAVVARLLVRAYPEIGSYRRAMVLLGFLRVASSNGGDYVLWTKSIPKRSY